MVHRANGGLLLERPLLPLGRRAVAGLHRLQRPLGDLDLHLGDLERQVAHARQLGLQRDPGLEGVEPHGLGTRLPLGVEQPLAGHPPRRRGGRRRGRALAVRRLDWSAFGSHSRAVIRAGEGDALSRLSGRRKFDVAALPPEEQIQLHVDGRIFMSYLRTPKLQPNLREKLARGLFERYKQERISMAEGGDERRALETDRSMRDWDDLSLELKESTRAQADDIPRKLRALGCFMLEEDRSEPLVRVHAFSEEELEVLSEMEHERFNAERLQRQWKIGPRNSKQRTTPFLVP